MRASQFCKHRPKQITTHPVTWFRINTSSLLANFIIEWSFWLWLIFFPLLTVDIRLLLLFLINLFPPMFFSPFDAISWPLSPKHPITKAIGFVMVATFSHHQVKKIPWSIHYFWAIVLFCFLVPAKQTTNFEPISSITFFCCSSMVCQVKGQVKTTKKNCILTHSRNKIYNSAIFNHLFGKTFPLLL